MSAPVPSPRMQSILCRFTWIGLGFRLLILGGAIMSGESFLRPALMGSVAVYAVGLILLQRRLWNTLIVAFGLEWVHLIQTAILTFGWQAGFGLHIYALPVSTLLFTHIALRWRVILAGMPVLLYLPVSLFTLPPPPEIVLEPTLLKAVQAINAFAFFGFVAVVVWEVLHKLAREKERAAALAESRSRLIANLSHEIKTPLAAMQTSVQSTLTRPRESAEYRETLLLCERVIRQMGSLAGRMLDSTTVGLGGVTPHLQVVDLPALLRRSVALHEPLLAAKSGRIELVTHESATCHTDPELLAVIVNNLLANAVRYSPPGGTVRVMLNTALNGTPTITVRDEGPGISEADQAHIFDAFYRAEKARSRSEGSAGLGLAIAAEYAGLLGCTLAVESAVGAGSTFTIRLPV